MWTYFLESVFYNPITPRNTLKENAWCFLNRLAVLLALGLGLSILFMIAALISITPGWILAMTVLSIAGMIGSLYFVETVFRKRKGDREIIENVDGTAAVNTGILFSMISFFAMCLKPLKTDSDEVEGNIHLSDPDFKQFIQVACSQHLSRFRTFIEIHEPYLSINDYSKYLKEISVLDMKVEYYGSLTISSEKEKRKHYELLLAVQRRTEEIEKELRVIIDKNRLNKD